MKSGLARTTNVLVGCGTRVAGWPVRLPLRRLGLFLRRFLDLELQQRPREIDRVDAIELLGCEPFFSQFVDGARHRLKVALQVKDVQHPGRVATTLTSSEHRSTRVVILRLLCQVGFVGASFWASRRSSKAVRSSQQRRPTRKQWRQAGSVKEMVSRPLITRTTSLFRKVWPLPKRTWTGVLG